MVIHIRYSGNLQPFGQGANCRHGIAVGLGLYKAGYDPRNVIEPHSRHYCRLKAYYCIDFLGRKNQSFRNKSGKTQPIRTKFGVRGHVNGLQRSGNFWCDRPILGKMGAGTSPAEREFLCVVIHATYRQLRNG